MAKDHPLTVRLADEHVFALDVIAAAEGTSASGAVRWLIERYALNRQNPQLLAALPDELHAQVPTLLSAGRGRTFDPVADAIWLDAHHGPHEDDDE
jgi:hypothetical protein